jgi:hypothetical protein
VDSLFGVPLGGVAVRSRVAIGGGHRRGPSAQDAPAQCGVRIVRPLVELARILEQRDVAT